VVFTKYVQFLRNVVIDLEDRHYKDPNIDVSEEAKEMAVKQTFEDHFLGPLGKGIPWVQLRGGFRIKYPGNILISSTAMNKQGAHCDPLIEATAALNNDVALMLVAVQKNNLGLSVNLALKRSVLQVKRT